MNELKKAEPLKQSQRQLYHIQKKHKIIFNRIYCTIEKSGSQEKAARCPI